MNTVLDSALWSGSAHPALAQRIAAYLDCPLWPLPIQQFSDGETAIQIPHTFKTRTLTIVQSLCAPVNHHLMELLLMVDAAHQIGCEHLSVLIPYFAYARQDSPAKLVADLLAIRPIDRIITLDLHHRALEKCFSIPLKHLQSTGLFADAIQKKQTLDGTQHSKPLIVSPDVGAAHRAQKLAAVLNTHFIVIDKKAPELCMKAVSETHFFSKDAIKNRCCIMIDDIVDSGKTLCDAARFLKEQGASTVFAYTTHAVLSNHALETVLAFKALDHLMVSDSIPLSFSNQRFLEDHPQQAKKLEIVSVARLLADTLMFAS
jgi:ribose-phosphate pyrophosphokinase